jgi:hypothetical protein
MGVLPKPSGGVRTESTPDRGVDLELVTDASLVLEDDVYALAKAVRLLAVTLQSSLGTLSDALLPAAQREVALALVTPRLGAVVGCAEKIIERMEG